MRKNGFDSYQFTVISDPLWNFLLFLFFFTTENTENTEGECKKSASFAHQVKAEGACSKRTDVCVLPRQPRPADRWSGPIFYGDYPIHTDCGC